MCYVLLEDERERRSITKDVRLQPVQVDKRRATSNQAARMQSWMKTTIGNEGGAGARTKRRRR
jgi:hypothetical protein